MSSNDTTNLRNFVNQAKALRLLDLNNLKYYYGVNKEPLEIHEKLSLYKGPKFEEELINRKEISNKISLWDPSKDPLVYAIVGVSGVGKSWLTYRIVREALLSEANIKAYAIDDMENFDYPKDRSLLLIDDSRVSESELKEAYKLLIKAVKKQEKEVTGPIIITTTDIDWDTIYKTALNGLNSDEEKERLKSRTVIVNVGKASKDEMHKILDQLLGGKIPISNDLKEKIIENANGLPIILRYFIEGKKAIRQKDIDEIEKDPVKYAAKKIEQFYLFDCKISSRRKEDKKDFLLILALLGAILKTKNVVLGEIDKDALNLIYGEDYEKSYIIKSLDALFNEQKKLKTKQPKIGTIGLTMKGIYTRFPLFETDPIYGEIRPIHNSVKKGYDYLFKSIFESYESEIDDCIKNLRSQMYNVEEYHEVINGILKELERIPQNYFKFFEDYLKNKEKYKRYNNKRKKLAYDILSVEFLHSLWYNKDIFELMALDVLVNIDDIDDKLLHGIVNLLFNDFVLNNINALSNIDDFHKLFLGALKSNDEYVRSRAWENLTKLIDRGMIDKRDSDYFLSLLKSRDEKVRLTAWENLTKLIDRGIVELESVKIRKNYFLSLLKSSNEYVRLTAWADLTKLISKKILGKREDYFLSLLRSSNEYVRLYAWYNVLELMDKGLVDYEKVKERKNYFHSLLRSGSQKIRLTAWYNVLELMDKGLVDYEKVKENRSYFLSLLKSNNEYVRLTAWENLTKLIYKGFIDFDKVKERKNYFLSLLQSENKYVRSRAWENLTKLIDIGILSKDYIKDNK
ncbi:HEAT repeat domain-containing protein [Caldisphaera sp.]|uniref:HEAT repeat domain-containing protein n=1 Tax=Caldisphaera sp. TaxID=2060322 RepID=UPI003D09D0E4